MNANINSPYNKFIVGCEQATRNTTNQNYNSGLTNGIIIGFYIVIFLGVVLIVYDKLENDRKRFKMSER